MSCYCGEQRDCTRCSYTGECAKYSGISGYTRRSDTGVLILVGVPGILILGCAWCSGTGGCF